MNSSNINQACSLCGNDILTEKKSKLLYGHLVCKKCYNAFANRRQFAFFIDMVIWRIILLVFAIGIATVSTTTIETKADESAGMLMVFFMFIWLIIFLIKDGFGGYSPGKALMRVQVIDTSSGKPIGLWPSFKRNLPRLSCSCHPT